MGNYSGIKQNVNTSIYENTNGDITGNVLNSVLQAIIETEEDTRKLMWYCIRAI